MKTTYLIWIIGGILSLLMISVYAFVLNFFVEQKSIPIIWILVNFVPITLVLGFYAYKKVNIESKWSTILLSFFIIICFLSAFSRIFLPNLNAYEQTVQYTPYFLIPLQLIILVLFFRKGKKSDGPISAESVLEMEFDEVEERIKILMEKRKKIQDAYDITVDAEMKFSYEKRIELLTKDIELLKKRMEELSKEND